MFIISGCNGAGKTTASYTLLPKYFRCSQFVNADEFAKSHSPFDPSSAAIHGSRMMMLKIRYLMDRKEDFCVETTLATKYLTKLIQSARALGYSVTIMYFWLASPEVAIGRVRARVEAGGHEIDEETIRRRYWTGLHYLFREYIPICDRWILADNTSIPFTIVAEGGKEEGFTIKDTEKFNRIQEMHTEYEQHLRKQDSNKESGRQI
ncbi:MAG: zeta toxin family protein [Bacteroidales bacterium]|nr:zeta toxin family protein [Bacteroidales bacterium]